MSNEITKSDISNKFKLAAEELIRASSILVESTSETMQELKNVSTSFSNMEQRLSDLQETFDSKINTLNQRLSTIESQLAASAKAEDQSKVQLTKNQSIDWALEHAHLNQFSFTTLCHPGLPSEKFVKDVLLFFRRGFGRYISNEYHISKTYNPPPSDNEKQQAFRDALSKQLHELLGQKPRIVLEDGDDRYRIYYS